MEYGIGMSKGDVIRSMHTDLGEIEIECTKEGCLRVTAGDLTTHFLTDGARAAALVHTPHESIIATAVMGLKRITEMRAAREQAETKRQRRAERNLRVVHGGGRS